MFKAGGGHFTYGHQPAWCKDITVHLVQKLMDSWPVGVEATPVAIQIVREARVFGDQIHHIQTQPVYPAIGPELTDFFQFCAYCWVFPVEIGLFWCKQMQIILFAFCVPAPGIAAEFRTPVIWWYSWFAATPDIKLTIRAFFVQRLAKPGVLGRSMVKHHIKNNANTARFRLRHQFVKIIQRAIRGINRRIVRHVVTVIDLGRDIKGGQPDSIDPQFL